MVLKDAQRICSPKGEKLFIPRVWISDSEEPNYITRPILLENGTLEYDLGVCLGLVKRIHDVVYAKYTDDVLRSIPLNISAEDIRQKIFAYAIKAISLHELFHMWHSHVIWHCNYFFKDWNDIIEGDGLALFLKYKDLVDDIDTNHREQAGKFKEQFSIVLNYKISQQAFEADADRSAVCFLTNKVIEQMKQMDTSRRFGFCTEELPLLMAGVCCADYVFSKNPRKQYTFSSIPMDRANLDHPTPATRFFMERYQVERLIRKRIKDRKIRDAVLNYIRMFIDNIEREYANIQGEEHIFYDMAYCENSQVQVATIKRRYNQVYDTLRKLCICELEKPYEPVEMKMDKKFFKFTNEGQRL